MHRYENGTNLLKGARSAKMNEAIRGSILVNGTDKIKLSQSSPCLDIKLDSNAGGTGTGTMQICIVVAVWDRSNGKICYSNEANYELKRSGESIDVQVQGEHKGEWSLSIDTIDTTHLVRDSISLQSQVQVAMDEIGCQTIGDLSCWFLIKAHA